jgi:predicted DCC family thiol-disulfide oxidoreductase YuxK
MEHQVVFFDDICVLCSRSVRFIYRHDFKGRFRFASFDSKVFKEVSGQLPEMAEVGGNGGAQDAQSVIGVKDSGGSQSSPDTAQIGGSGGSQDSSGTREVGDSSGLQASAGAAEIQANDGSQESPGSVILYRHGRVYYRSGAALRIAMSLKFPMPLLAVGFVLPPFIRNGIYDWIARNRYRWFGKRESCFLPDVGLRERFLE